MYLGFDKATTGQHELDGRRAQFPSGANEESPCGKFADLNAENVQFNSAKLPTKTDAITISLWIKILTQTGIQPVLVVGGEDGELRLEIAQGHLSWMYTSIGPPLATFALLSVVPVVPVGLWTHLVVQYDTFTGRSAAFRNSPGCSFIPLILMLHSLIYFNMNMLYRIFNIILRISFRLI